MKELIARVRSTVKFRSPDWHKSRRLARELPHDHVMLVSPNADT
jgi:hypothetical protein